MKKIVRQISFLFVLLTGVAACSLRNKEKATIAPPEELYGDLFYRIQSDEDLFSDSKTFPDAVPLSTPEIIRSRYAANYPEQDSDLVRFIHKNFRLPEYHATYRTDSAAIRTHISRLWTILTRQPDKKVSGTLIPLPYPYIVPGGRFREVYYWDSYFTALGLQADRKTEMIRNIADNFTWLIDTFGFVPNGNRTYYLSRSQPPFYPLIVQLLVQEEGEQVLKQHLQTIEKEYRFWMDGAFPVTEEESYRRMVRMPGGEVLNRYWDDQSTPRAESYREDMSTAAKAVVQIAGNKQSWVFRHIRAAAESGWDFSSRWLATSGKHESKLYSIHTTDIIPVDLNALLYEMERMLSRAYDISGNKEKAAVYRLRAQTRKEALIKYCWSTEHQFFMDYDYKQGTHTGVFSLAGVYPLFFEMADHKQADLVAARIRNSFLKPGGLITTLNHTGQQWDAPNGWAPLQWMAIKALRNYNHNELAGEIRKRWMLLVEKVYNRTYILSEKYNVEDLSLEAGGGEYPNQDGFGWTNGVYQKLANETAR